MSVIKLSDIIAPVFVPIHLAIKNQSHSIFWIKGGRGSTKSSYAAIETILQIMKDPNANALVLRKVGETIRTSVLSNLQWAIEQLGVSHLFKLTYAPAEMTYIPTGQKIIMKGLDSPLKLKSIKIKNGYFKILWFEEGAEFNGMEEIRSVRQSVKRGGEYFIELFTYNPPNDPHSWVNVDAKLANDKRIVHHSTFKDVPPEWLGQEFIDEANWLRENNPLAYDHEYMGIPVGIHEAIIFSGKTKVMDFQPKPEWGAPLFGADFGFSQDPNTLVKCWVEDVGGRLRLYIEREAFGIGIELDDMPKFYDQIPDSRKYKIYADCSRPETISHIKNKGFNIVAAEKWQGSVEDGISVLKSFVDIVIHPRCVNMQEEARLYSYKIDKVTKDITPDIVDKYNHGWDAVRYALSTYIKRKPKGFFS